MAFTIQDMVVKMEDMADKIQDMDAEKVANCHILVELAKQEAYNA